jgi:hypothetical protein
MSRQQMGRGAQAAIRVDRPHEELAAVIAAEGPYDLVVDYLWGAPRRRSSPITLRSAPVQLFGSGIGGPAALGGAAAAYGSLLKQVAAGEIGLDIDLVPLARVEQAWPRAGSDRRIVFVP